MGELNKQKSTLADEKRQLETKVSTLEQENNTLHASLASKSSAPTPAPASVSSEETQKLNALIVSNLLILGIPVLTIVVQTSLRTERDKLLSEKESWNKSSASALTTVESNPTPSEWEAEKTELIKARDEALEKLKV